ncbi:hypothetical protein SUGI_1119150 [Cryptomeria japonica]|nr:hypothetical protein SUGI_1119150 [Cryptomeria japonica]
MANREKSKDLLRHGPVSDQHLKRIIHHEDETNIQLVKAILGKEGLAATGCFYSHVIISEEFKQMLAKAVVDPNISHSLMALLVRVKKEEGKVEDDPFLDEPRQKAASIQGHKTQSIHSELHEEVHELRVDGKILEKFYQDLDVAMQHMVIAFHNGTLELTSSFTMPLLENDLLASRTQNVSDKWYKVHGAIPSTGAFEPLLEVGPMSGNGVYG